MDERYIDANFIGENEDSSTLNDREINGEPLFYTTLQVSKILKFPVSTIRLYTSRFNELLDIEPSNKNNQYKKTDIEKLRFILNLTKKEGLTIQQAKDYCSRKGFNLDDIEKAVMDSNNPLALQTFITATTMEMDKKLTLFTENLFEKITKNQQQNNENLQELIAVTVEDIIVEKFDLSAIQQIKSQEDFKDYISSSIKDSFQTQTKDIKSAIDTMEQNAIKNITEKEDALKLSMETRHSQEAKKKKTFYQWLFNK